MFSCSPADFGKILRMFSKQGFADLFWEELQEARKKDKCVTQEVVFDILNEKYFKAIGCLRYSCFDSFRIVRDKKNDAHQTRK
jgi:hypothetical protein